STLAARGSGTINFQFNGRLLEDAGSSTSLFVDVKGGNKPALKKLLGQGRTQQFTVGSNTQYIRWSHGVPTVVDESNLVAGDRVTVNVRAPRSSTLAEIEATAAWRVADRGPFGHSPRQPLWLFIGTLQAPAANHHFSLTMTDGNRRALRALLGQPLGQTFTYDAHTIFVLWQAGVPHVISPSQLVVGDRVSVRTRAPQASTLAQVEATAANHVGDHEPFSNVSTP
ncbi:MAG TPA: hypothetical protein VJ814_05560, partial [Gaiellaceae bacterium]|nr:hypothetical protein [Gaiellaceae bacterium]